MYASPLNEKWAPSISIMKERVAQPDRVGEAENFTTENTEFHRGKSTEAFWNRRLPLA
jgi:hypothetical protein